MSLCEVMRLGVVPYRDAWELQRRLVAARVAGEIPDTLLLLEHPPVYTLGRSGHLENVLLDADQLKEQGAELVWVDRGGDVTYHGPGQLVGYPILHLELRGKDVHRHARGIEETIIRSLQDFGVVGWRDPAYPGVWVGEGEAAAKVAAIGVRVSKWVTSHGFALNVSTDLRCFTHIIPCGIQRRGVTSLETLLDRSVTRREAEDALLRCFAEVFEVELSTEGDTHSRGGGSG